MTEQMREEFEAWLLEVHMLEGTWSEQRGCYDEFPCHLALKAWQAATARAAPKWLPIAEAPKDVRILVGPTKRMEGPCIAMLHSRDGWVVETPSEWMTIYTPVIWAPLPEWLRTAPAQEAG